MVVPQVVIDTNVLIAALRSQFGASYQLLLLSGSDKFEINLSVPLVLEYEEAAKRYAENLGLSFQTIEDIIGYLCSIARRHQIYYLWRPLLPDPSDEMVLEVAVAGRCDFLLTYNERDFRPAKRFAVKVVTPQEFLREIGEIP
jgi:putative PIN family toxin of toxin-antitoxin system